jgi:hypothetical protein
MKCAKNKIKYKHKRNKTRLWNKITPQIKVEQIKHNGGFKFYLYPFGELAHESFHMTTDQKTFLKTFWIVNDDLWMNYELIKNEPKVNHETMSEF